ncbi:MAG: hypothetical protein PHV05_06095 [Candidatus Riflebacteria bacterium]|nr:hypothetical protein [Candidatus Riflebacteria bacterium]
MTTAYEYLARDRRRIKAPVFSAAVLLAVTCLLGGVFAVTRYYSGKLESDYAKAAGRVANESQNFIDSARTLLPQESTIIDIEQNTETHNLAIVGNFSVWTKLFNNIETALPENSVITAIENTLTGSPVFKAEDRFFRIRIAVAGMEQSNTLYAKLAENKHFESLSFTPKGEISYQGRNGISIELEFKFNEFD